MPSASVSFRPTPIAVGTGMPASAYAREQRILRAYRQALHALTEEAYQQLVARLVEGCMQPKRNPTRSQDSAKLRNAREERIYDDIPELIQCLRWDEQLELHALLVTDEPDLFAAITLVLSQERILLQREVEYTGLDDLAHIRAAGLGKISSQNYGALRRAQQQVSPGLTPAPIAVEPVLHSVPPVPARPLPPCRLRPKRKTLQGQVARAQERKRLKRKRRR